jgi:arsenate reductase-like glutaredoxin family protein
MGCKKAQGFLEANAAEPAEKVDAAKKRFGRDEALKLAKSADKVVVGKGKKVVVFDMKTAPPDDDALAAQLLGPSGNLKAPTLRMGRTLLVGFSEAAYRQVFGGHDL